VKRQVVVGGDKLGARRRAYGRLFGFGSGTGTGTDERSFIGREGGIGAGIGVITLVVLATGNGIVFYNEISKGE
jgi:hypothetical protein